MKKYYHNAKIWKISKLWKIWKFQKYEKFQKCEKCRSGKRGCGKPLAIWSSWSPDPTENRIMPGLTLSFHYCAILHRYATEVITWQRPSFAFVNRFQPLCLLQKREVGWCLKFKRRRPHLAHGSPVWHICAAAQQCRKHLLILYLYQRKKKSSLRRQWLPAKDLPHL